MSILLFYILSALLIVFALNVVMNSNPVYSVLSLILAFVISAGIFLIMGSEYIAMTLVIVYVGAVMVLFLFVVMMLDIKIHSIFEGAILSKILISTMIFCIFAGMITIFYKSFDGSEKALNFAQKVSNIKHSEEYSNIMKDDSNLTNAKMIGMKLYTEYFLQFQFAGFILLVAMIGAILLVAHSKKNVLRQDVMKQMARDPKKAVQNVAVNFNEGAKEVK